MENNKINPFNILAVVGMSLVIIFVFSLSSKMNRLEQDLNEMRFDNLGLSEQINTLIEMNNIVSDSEYRVERVEKEGEFLAKVAVELSSNKLGAYKNLMLLYRKTFDYKDADNYDYANEPWENMDINSSNGTYLAELMVPYSGNYELKLAFEDSNQMTYEQLPPLDLYAKSEAGFMKDINIYGIKNAKLEFDVQISTFKVSEESKLLGAVCNIYYGSEEIDSIDILKENLISGRKEPRKQLEHLGGDYWFIIDEVDFSQVDGFDPSKVLVELILIDSTGNNYKMSKGID